MNKEFYDKLDIMIPNPVCELNYNKDYELLIAVMLSAQTTDKRVNIVTKKLFIYSLEDMKDLDIEIIMNIIKSLGTYQKKAKFVKDIAKRLIEDNDGIVPNDREYLESLPGVGRKTTNVVLANLFDVPSFAVDTHVLRTSKILKLTKNDIPIKVEFDIMKKIPKYKWNKVNSQLVLFGRYICKSKKPSCEMCLFSDKCKINKKSKL